MSNDHRRTFVPVEAWEYNSPLLKVQGHHTDIGLFAEALLYYDQVIVDIQTPRQLADIVAWAARNGHIGRLIQIIRDGIVTVHHHGFLTGAVNQGGIYSVWNVQELGASDEHFLERVVYHADLRTLHSRQSAALIKAIEGNFLVSRAHDYELPVADSRVALRDPAKCSRLVQTFVDEIFEHGSHQIPPEISCVIHETGPETWNATYNVDFARIGSMTGGKLDFRADTPILGEAQCNKVIWTASRLGVDLYLGAVLSALTRAKLTEARDRSGRPQEIIDELELEVELPDVHQAVNDGHMDLGEVLGYRDRAARFRDWLRMLSETDRSAALAYYHDEFSASPAAKGALTTLKLFGALSSVAVPVSPALHSTIIGPTISVAGGAATFLSLVAERYVSDWKPRVFGDWLGHQAKKRR